VKRIHVAGLCVVLCLLLVHCSSGNTPATTTMAGSGFQIVSPATSPAIDVGNTVTITASAPAMWSLQPLNTNQPVGTLSNTTTASTTVTYTAPSSVMATAEVSVVATAASDSTQSASIGVVINPSVLLNSFSTHLTDNTSCQYTFGNGNANNDGTVGSNYAAVGTSKGLLTVNGGTAPYSWELVSGSLPIGLSLGSMQSGTSCSTSCAYLYGTPVSAGCSQFQVQVTDATGGTATSPTYYVVITPAPLKVQAPDYIDWYAGIAYAPTAFSVSGGTPPYTWSPDPAAPLPSSLTLTTPPQDSAMAYISGVPGALPETPPSLIVADSQTPYPAIGTVNLNQNSGAQFLPSPQSPCTPFQNNGVNSGTYNASMMGSYAFLLHGFDANGPVIIAGSFSADGAGNVQAGVEDVLRTTTSGALADDAVTGTYSVFQQQSDNNTFREVGCVTLTDSASNINTFAFTLGGCTGLTDPTSGECLANAEGVAGVFTDGRIIEFDNTGTSASGILRQQDSSAFSAGLSGSYSFGLSGWDSSGTPGTRYAAAGSVSASSGSFSSAAADINDGGALQSALTGGSGSYTIDSTTDAENGRGTASLSVGSATFNLAFYVVSANEVILASTGTPSAANPIVGGEAIGSVGPFSALSLQNTHMFHTAGFAPAGPDANIGILSFDGVSSFSGTQYEDQAATIGTTSLSGSYAVDAKTGRFAFIPSTTNAQSLGDHPLVGYVIPVSSTLTRQNCNVLADCVTGFLVSTDQTAQAGLLEFQTPSIAPPPPFSAVYVEGYYFYGTDEGLDSATPLIDGASVANPTGTVYGGVQSTNFTSNSFYCQQEPNCALLHPNEAISPSAAYSVSSNGTGTMGGETVAVTNGNVIFYIDESPINAHPSVIVVEQ
jgi:large repetitive protein